MIGQVLKKLVNQKRGLPESSNQMNLHWHSDCCTSLGNRTSLEKLQHWIQVLMGFTPKVQNKLTKVMSQALHHAGWQETIHIQT